jgi:hypothetical protein
MHPAIADRLAVTGEIFQPAWRWLVVAPFALLSIAQTARDELLATEVAEKYKLSNLFHYIPDIDWRWYLAMLLGAVVIVLIEGAFRAVRNRESQIAHYANLLVQQDEQMVGALSIQVATHFHREENSNRCGLQLYFILTSTYPINYGIIHAEISFEGRPAPEIPASDARTGVIVPSESRRYFFPTVPNIPWNDERNWIGSAKYQIWFGPVGGPFRYYIDSQSWINIYGDSVDETYDRDTRGILVAQDQTDDGG